MHIHEILRVSTFLNTVQEIKVLHLTIIAGTLHGDHYTCLIISHSSGNFFRVGGGDEFTPGIFFGGGSNNSVEDRGQRERGSGGGSPIFRGSTRFANT
jgi:hypothetical protein